MTMDVMLKFKLTEKNERVWPVLVDGVYRNKKVGGVVMYPVTGNDNNEENKKFYDATPSGKLEFGSINEAALDSLELGKEYYITISLAN
jgi:hypothetical protein